MSLPNIALDRPVRRDRARLGKAETRETVQDLQARIAGMQRTEIDSAPLPTPEAVAALLPGGSLRAGAVYSVRESSMLAMALMAGPSTAGAWCGVLGVPGFGVEAAERIGVNSERLVLVPEPGARWLEVAAALADVVTVVVARPPARLPVSELERLSSRLRQRGGILIALGPWQRPEATLVAGASRWDMIGRGHGYLGALELGVQVTDRAGRRRAGRIGFPATGGLSRPESPDPLRAAPDLRIVNA